MVAGNYGVYACTDNFMRHYARLRYTATMKTDSSLTRNGGGFKETTVKRYGDLVLYDFPAQSNSLVFATSGRFNGEVTTQGWGKWVFETDKKK